MSLADGGRWAGTLLGIFPLLWLASAKVVGRDYWLVAASFAISFLADVGAIAIPERYTAFVYPLAQCGLIGLALLPLRDGIAYVVALLLVAVGVLQWYGAEMPDFEILFRTVAFGSVAGMVCLQPSLGRLGRALTVYFGLSLMAWYLWALCQNLDHPATLTNWLLWGGYQMARVVGIGLFCWAAVHQTPRLVIVLGSGRRAA